MANIASLASSWVYMKSLMTHNMAQIFHLVHFKRAFGFFYKQVVILKKFQDSGNMLMMSFPRLTIDEDVIKEDEDKGLSEISH